MQREGFDLQLDGFGLMSTYHANNECCLLSDMRRAFCILLKVYCLLNSYDRNSGVDKSGSIPRS